MLLFYLNSRVKGLTRPIRQRRTTFIYPAAENRPGESGLAVGMQPRIDGSLQLTDISAVGILRHPVLDYPGRHLKVELAARTRRGQRGRLGERTSRCAPATPPWRAGQMFPRATERSAPVLRTRDRRGQRPSSASRTSRIPSRGCDTFTDIGPPIRISAHVFARSLLRTVCPISYQQTGTSYSARIGSISPSPSNGTCL